jgi:hypothetical protein
VKSNECTCTHAPEQHHNGVGIGCLLHGCACQASRLDISDAVAKARGERIDVLEELLASATEFTIVGPGGRWWVRPLNQYGIWTIGQSGWVGGERFGRDEAVAKARELSGAPVSPSKAP